MRGSASAPPSATRPWSPPEDDAEREPEVRRIMDGDPDVQAGVFTDELHPCRSFPGLALPQT